jgi:hypothetical protein
MQRVIASTVTLVLLASATGTVAKPSRSHSATRVLQQGLQVVAQSAVAQSQGQQLSPQAQTVDHDQGDDHASDVAILTVCSHSNPSAQRSAICTQPNSPP